MTELEPPADRYVEMIGEASVQLAGLLDSLSLGDFAFELPHHCLKISGTPLYPLLQIFVQLENFVFRELANRDIFSDPGDTIDRAGRVMYRKRPVPNPANSALRTDDSIFLIIESVHLFLQGGIENFHPVFGVNRIEPGTRRSIQTFAGSAPDFFVPGTDVQHLVLVVIREPENFPDMVRHLAEALLGLAQGAFNAFGFES